MAMNDKPQIVLMDLLKTHGHVLCDDSRRVEALLKDLCPECKREINVLVAAHRERIPQELLATSSVPFDIVSARLIRRLQEDLALAEDAAGWAVACWGAALELTSVSVHIRQRAVSTPPKVVTVVPPTPPLTQQSGVNRDGFIFEDDVVSDSRTGLMWARNANFSEKKMNWHDATEWVKTLTLGGYRDWRLPTKNELLAMMKLGGKSPSAHFADLGFIGFAKFVGWYWSSTDSTTGSGDAWIVEPWDCDEYYDTKVKGFNYVWPVRTVPVEKSEKKSQRWDKVQNSMAGIERTTPNNYLALSDNSNKLRFIFSSLTALDTTTGLIWTKNGNLAIDNPIQKQNLYELLKKSSSTEYGKMTWLIACDFIALLNKQSYAGFLDWRLPTKAELENMALYGQKSGWGDVDGHRISDYFNSLGFEKVQMDWYWSSANPYHTEFADIIFFGDLGNLRNSHPKNYKYYVWPVRTG
jgi:hypothetical protein